MPVECSKTVLALELMSLLVGAQLRVKACRMFGEGTVGGGVGAGSAATN